MKPRPVKSLEERMWANVSPEPNSGCWLWTSTTVHHGYGLVKDQHPSKKTLLAHRVAFRLWVGPIADGMHVLHRCDVTCCVNPRHLFLGTHFDNMRDMAKKGRGRFPKGTAHHCAKLDDQVVAVCRQAFKLGANGAGLARAFKVNASTMQRILKGDAWKP